MIQLLTQPAPSVDREITCALNEMYPRTFLQWEPRYALEPGGGERWQARWELWIELRDTTHPGIRSAVHKLDDEDRWNTDAQCWMRYLQAYQTREYEFAPVDERLIVGLTLADTWTNRRFYEDHIEDPDAAADLQAMNINRAAIAGAASYYRKFDNPIVGRHVNSGWRAKLGM